LLSTPTKQKAVGGVLTAFGRQQKRSWTLACAHDPGRSRAGTSYGRQAQYDKASPEKPPATRGSSMLFFMPITMSKLRPRLSVGWRKFTTAPRGKSRFFKSASALEHADGCHQAENIGQQHQDRRHFPADHA